MTPQQLKAWRASRDITQSQAATLLGVSLRTLQYWEGGRQIPKTAKLLITKDNWRTNHAI